MLKIVKDIVEFHAAGEVPIRETPSIPDPDRVQLRKNLISEEVRETLEAIDAEDLVEIADGLADSIVVIVGTALEYGIDLTSVWDEVHRTNMAKFPDGKVVRRESDGKILKPEGWTPPDIVSVLEYQAKTMPLKVRPEPTHKVGDRVKALVTITEDGYPENADPEAKFPSSHYIHANVGDMGTVVYIEEDEEEAFTVRYDQTGTATLTALREVKFMEAPLWEELEGKGMQAEELDEMVDDLVSKDTSGINNEGLEGQIKFLLANGVSPLEIAGKWLP